MSAGTLTASPLFSWGAPRVRTGRPREWRPAPHWREILRWSLEWPEAPDDGWAYLRPEYQRVVGRWRVRVA
jgi:hypothetical protein